RVTPLAARQKWLGVIYAITAMPDEVVDDDLSALLAHARAEIEAQARREAEEPERAYPERFSPVQSQLRAENYAQALDLLESLLQQQPADREATAIVAGLIENPALALEQRLRAGRLAAQYGDPRPGVCTLEPAWCGPFPAGEYPIAVGQAS